MNKCIEANVVRQCSSTLDFKNITHVQLKALAVLDSVVKAQKTQLCGRRLEFCRYYEGKKADTEFYHYQKLLPIFYLVY